MCEVTGHWRGPRMVSTGGRLEATSEAEVSGVVIASGDRSIRRRQRSGWAAVLGSERVAAMAVR